MAVSGTRTDKILVGIVVVILLGGIIFAMSFSEPPTRSFVPMPSSFSNTKTGTRALFLTWQAMGYDVQRLHQMMDRTTLIPFDGLVVLDPMLPVQEQEMGALQDWVRDGGTLLVTTDSVSLDDWFKLADATAVKKTAGESDDDEPAPEGVLADDLTAGVREMEHESVRRFSENPVTVARLRGADVKVLWRDAKGVLAFRLRHGRGSMIVLAEPYVLSNESLGNADHAPFIANLARALTGGDVRGVIAFDEYHHGYMQRDASTLAILKLVFGFGRGWGTAQLAIVGLLTMVMLGKRFGKPIDLVQRKRRKHSEFVDATAWMLARSGGTLMVFDTLYRHYRAKLCKLTHLSFEESDERLAAAVRKRVGVDIREPLEAKGIYVGQRSMSSDTLVRQVQTLHRAVEAFEHGAK